MSTLLILGCCILLSAGASFFLKIGAASFIGRLDFLTLITNPMIWVGGLLYAAAFLGYIYVLRITPLSLAQPVITAGVSVCTVLAATLFLSEQLNAANWLGLFLTCLGIFFLFWGRG